MKEDSQMPISRQLLDKLKRTTDSMARGIEEFASMTDNIPECCSAEQERAYCELESTASLLHAAGKALGDTLETVRRSATADKEQGALWAVLFEVHRLEKLREKFQLHRRQFELHREQYLRGMN
jgi:hypothetical protein